MLFYDMLIPARARDIRKSKHYRVEIIPRSLIKPEGNGTYRARSQNIARKGRNGRPAPCQPFCPFFHIRAILCDRAR